MPALRHFGSVAPGLAFTSGAVALFGISELIIGGEHSAVPDTPVAAMSPITAALLLCLSVAVIASTINRTAIAQGPAAFACGLAAAILMCHAFTNGDALSPVIARAFVGHEVPAARTSVATALAIFTIASALLTRRSYRLVADVSAATAVTIALTALFGYSVSAAALYEIPMFSTMALNTALSILGLSVAALWLPFVRGEDVAQEAIWMRMLHTAPLMLVPVATCILLVAHVDLNFVAIASVIFMVMLAGSMPFCLMIWRDDELSRQ